MLDHEQCRRSLSVALVMTTNSTVYKEVHNNKRKTGIFTTAVIYISGYF
jgi:hypothetical protein